MATARRPEFEEPVKAARPPPSAPPDPRPPARRRRLRLPALTAGVVPALLVGTDVLLAESGSRIQSDVVFVLLALLTVSAAGFLIGVLGVVLFALLDRDRTERLVMIISALLRRGRRRRPPE
jgi:hypothetical protein